ncbi:hypothetical protein KAR91_00625 [Candidatus Pacearchaeota archaeon]|nr:hypothetical protein [Candidatus Pacearchaeota archaeon]
MPYYVYYSIEENAVIKTVSEYLANDLEEKGLVYICTIPPSYWPSVGGSNIQTARSYFKEAAPINNEQRKREVVRQIWPHSSIRWSRQGER